MADKRGVSDELSAAAFAAKDSGFERLCLRCLKGFDGNPCPRCAPVSPPAPAPGVPREETRCADCIGGYTCEALNGDCVKAPLAGTSPETPAVRERRLADIAARVRLPLLDLMTHPNVPGGKLRDAKLAFERYVIEADAQLRAERIKSPPPPPPTSEPSEPVTDDMLWDSTAAIMDHEVTLLRLHGVEPCEGSSDELGESRRKLRDFFWAKRSGRVYEGRNET